MTHKEPFNNKWPGDTTTWAPFNLPSYAQKKTGVLPMNAILDPRIGMETILCLFDSTDFIHKIAALRPFTLMLKAGVVRTSYGPVVFLLFWLPDPKTGTPFMVFEQTLNPHNPVILAPYYDLARQTHWHVFVLDRDGNELNWFEFKNIFGLQKTLVMVATMTSNMPCTDFNSAKQEYSQQHTIDELMEIE